MSSPFRTFLGLDAFEDRFTPSAAPITPDPAYADAATPAAAAPAPYVFIDFDGCDNNKDGRTDNITQFLVTVTFEDGSTMSVRVNVRAGQRSDSVALAVAAALRAEGVDCTANGSALEIRGRNGAAVEHVDIAVSGATLPQGSPYVNPPYISGENGATGRSFVNLPR